MPRIAAQLTQDAPAMQARNALALGELRALRTSPAPASRALSPRAFAALVACVFSACAILACVALHVI